MMQGGPPPMTIGHQSLPGDWNCPNCNDLQFSRNSLCRKCGTPRPMGGGGQMGYEPAGKGLGGKGKTQSPGDWICGNCGDLQFARNTQCRKCGEPKPVGSQAQGGLSFPSKPGDWNCPACGDLQFAKNANCRKCGTPHPEGGGGPPAVAQKGKGGRPGDWLCPGCGDLQFGRNAQCNRCGMPNPSPQSSSAFAPVKKPGDWSCPSCNDLVFARNSACRKCGTPNPDPEGSAAEKGKGGAPY